MPDPTLRPPHKVRSARLSFELLLGVGMRGAGALASFALTWLLARFYGAEALGNYQIALAGLTTLSLLASLGMELGLVRFLGKRTINEATADDRATFQRCVSSTLQVSVPLAVLTLVCLLVLPDRLGGEYTGLAPYFLALLPIVLLQPVLRLTNAVLRCFGKVMLSQSLDGIFYTGLACAVAAFAAWQRWENGPLAAAIAYSLAMTAAVCIALNGARSILSTKSECGTAQLSRFDSAIIGLVMLVTTLGNLLALYLVAGRLGIGDAGIFRTAFQIAMLMQLVNAAFGMMISPHMARATAADDRGEVVALVVKAAGLGLVLTSPVAVACLVFPAEAMGLFGPQFVAGAAILPILFFGQLADIVLGQAGTALVMLKRERLVLASEIAAFLAGIGTALATMPAHGMVGAALGLLVISLMRNALNALFLAMALKPTR